MHFDRHCTMPPWTVLARTLLSAGCLSLCQGCTQMASSASVASASSLVSSASSSELISSPFRSSSRSPGESPPEEQRQQEIEGYIIVLLRAGAGAGDRESVYRGLASIAARYGIGDWEAEPGSWRALGRGVAGAGRDAVAAAELAQRWSAGDSHKAALVVQGYEVGRGSRRVRL